MTTTISRETKVILLEILRTGTITDKQRDALRLTIGLPEHVITTGLEKFTDEELESMILDGAKEVGDGRLNRSLR